MALFYQTFFYSIHKYHSGPNIVSRNEADDLLFQEKQGGPEGTGESACEKHGKTGRQMIRTFWRYEKALGPREPAGTITRSIARIHRAGNWRAENLS